MFGISFGELLLIALIALLVLGPDRLPGAARTAGLWLGRLKRSLHAIKTDIEREIGADELRRHLRDESDLTPQPHAPQRSDHPNGLAEPPAAARAGGDETARAVCSASTLHTETSSLPPAPPPPAATP